MAGFAALPSLAPHALGPGVTVRPRGPSPAATACSTIGAAWTSSPPPSGWSSLLLSEQRPARWPERGTLPRSLHTPVARTGQGDSPSATGEEGREVTFPVFVVVSATVLCAELVIVGLFALASGRLSLTVELFARISTTASAGIAAAFVAALFSAVLEPVLNRVRVLGVTVTQAAADVEARHRFALFRTALATNLVKLPFFETLFAVLEVVPLPLLPRAAIAALAYTTVALPAVNYRYRRSVGLPLRMGDLYAAYAPTLARDLAYCLVRGLVADRLLASGAPWLCGTAAPARRFLAPFCAVLAGCLASAPGNEFRGYVLNRRSPRPKRLAEFFDVPRFLRKSLAGSLSMAAVVASGYLLVPAAEGLWLYLGTPASVSAPTGVWLAVGLAVGLVAGRMAPMQMEKYRFDRYAQQRQLVYLRMAQESENLQGGPAKARGRPARPRASASLAVQIGRFVLPACGLVAANQAMTAVDKAFVGRISSVQLAAMGSAATCFDCVSYVTTFINTACLSLLGTALATGDAALANEVRSHALVFSASLGGFLGIAMVSFSSQLCRLVGGAPQGVMLDAAVGYLSFRALGVPIERMISIGTTFCLAAKDGTTPLVVTAIGSIANVFLDWYFCLRYRAHAAAASAAASALAAGVSLIYLFCRLQAKGRWPRPLVWPRRRDFGPFAAFAGPVFLLLLVKSFTFTQMTAYASGLGTSTAAAHQIYVSLLFLTAVAVGTPLSWAAQSFMPEFLVRDAPEATARAGEGGGGEARRSGGAAACLRALLAVAAGCALLAGAAVALSLRYAPALLTSDPRVVAALRAPDAAVSLVGFVLLYPVFLALEGTLIAAQRLRLSLAFSAALLLCNAALFLLLGRAGRLSLGALWATASATLLLATASSALLAVRLCDGAAHGAPGKGRKAGGS